jgi:hypothetical protein
MRKKSHISLALYLVRELNMDGLVKHRKAFCLGSILPDLTPKMVTSPHEFETSYEEIKEIVRDLVTAEFDEDWNERVLWRRIGVVVHYIADYFTFPHNTSFDGNLKDHCMYESEMKYYLRGYVWTGEARSIFREARQMAKEIDTIEDLFDFIETSHRSYMQEDHNVKSDCRHILMTSSTALVALSDMAFGQPSFGYGSLVGDMIA